MIFGYCNDEHDHRRQAREDAACGRRDRDMYDRFSYDPCKEAYTDEYRREERRIEERGLREEEERRNERAMESRRYQEEMEQEQWSQLYELERPEPEYEYHEVSARRARKLRRNGHQCAFYRTTENGKSRYTWCREK